MSAQLAPRVPGHDWPPLVAALATLDGDALLSHFQTRRGVACFPVLDADAVRRDRVDAVLNLEFCFNGETHCLAQPIDWSTNPSADIEWHVMLHKFYYAPGLASAYRQTAEPCYLRQWIDLTESWIASTPADYAASPAMQPEVTQVMGRRLQNWIYAWHMFNGCVPPGAIPADFMARFLGSIYHQLAFLERNLSPARNHRTLELYALFLAAVVLPELDAAARWRQFALQELGNNLRSDLLADGVHCELSSHYHHLVVQSHLQVQRLALANGIETPAAERRLLERALEFAMHVHKPDGLIPCLSDSDSETHLHLLAQGYELFGREDMRFVASAGAEGCKPASRCAAFPESGYYTMRSGWGDTGRAYADERYLVFDCGPIGAGNHGHLDCLSIEAAACGRSLIVDPGRYSYDESGDDRGETNWRARFRATAAHNTVTVDGLDQACYERRAGKRRRKIYPPEPSYQVHLCSSMDGLDILHGSVVSSQYDAVHERAVYFLCADYWVIFDALRAPSARRYDLRFQLSEIAESRVTAVQGGDVCTVRSPHLAITHACTVGSVVNVDDGYVAYRYGRKASAPMLRFEAHGSDIDFVTVLYPFERVEPRIEVELLTVYEPGTTRTRSDCLALRIRVDRDGLRSTDHCFFAPARAVAGGAFAGFATHGRYLAARSGPGQTNERLWMPGGQDRRETTVETGS